MPFTTAYTCFACNLCLSVCLVATFVLGLAALSRPQRLNNLDIKCVYAALSYCRDSQGQQQVNLW